jgi:predicted Fe-Mo cluster-binding NifX family protein
MKIAVTSTGLTLNDNVEARFGRCPYFLIIETDTMEFEAIQNPNIALGGGAGTQSAQLMAEKGVSAVLTGNCGPNAFRVFGAAGITVITGLAGNVRSAVEQYKSGVLPHSSEPNVQSHFSMGGGGGRGLGRGMGRRQGFSRGLGDRGFAPPPQTQDTASSDKEDLESLKEIANSLRGQLDAIEARLMDLEKK